MLKINYKGYVISQASNNHVMICKNNKMVFHGQASVKLNKNGLKKVLEHYFKLKTKSARLMSLLKESGE